MSVNTWGAVNTWVDAGVDASISFDINPPAFNVLGGPVGIVSGSVAFSISPPLFNITGGVVTDYPIGSVSFTIKPPVFRDPLYLNQFSGTIKSTQFTGVAVSESQFIGVTR